MHATMLTALKLCGDIYLGPSRSRQPKAITQCFRLTFVVDANAIIVIHACYVALGGLDSNIMLTAVGPQWVVDPNRVNFCAIFKDFLLGRVFLERFLFKTMKSRKYCSNSWK